MSTIQQSVSDQNKIFKITYPINFSKINRNEEQIITVDGYSYKTSSVEYYINNVLIGESKKAPYSLSFIPSKTPSSNFEDELVAIEKDIDGTTKQSSVVYSVIK